MTVLAAPIPASLTLGLAGLAAFAWALEHRQHDDPQGDQHRALFGGQDDAPPSRTAGPETAIGRERAFRLWPIRRRPLCS